MNITRLAATLAFALTATPALSQTTTVRSEQEVAALRDARDNYYVEFRNKVELLRKLHVPGEATTWPQYIIYEQLVDAFKKQRLDLRRIGTTPAELNALVFGGPIV